MSKVEIIKEDIPMEALSDLESDAEDLSVQQKIKLVKEAALEGATSTWMSRKKIWTTAEVRYQSITW